MIITTLTVDRRNIKILNRATYCKVLKDRYTITRLDRYLLISRQDRILILRRLGLLGLIENARTIRRIGRKCTTLSNDRIDCANRIRRLLRETFDRRNRTYLTNQRRILVIAGSARNVQDRYAYQCIRCTKGRLAYGLMRVKSRRRRTLQYNVYDYRYANLG